jgi:hypothetical protein
MAPDPVNGFVFKDGSVPGVCKTCGAPSWSPRSNACADHRKTPAVKVKAKKVKTTSKGASAPRVNDDGSPVESSVVSQAVDAAGAITARTFSAKPPSASEWEDKLSALVVLLTFTYVEYVVVRPFHLPEDQAAHWVERLGMTDDEAEKIVEPCSFLIAKTDLNKKHGREAIEILAFAPAILAVVSWADRVSEFRREMQTLGGDNVVRFESPGPSQGPLRTESGAFVANFGGVTDPGQAPTASVDRNGADMEHTN